MSLFIIHFIARQCGHEGQFTVELELKSNLEQRLFIAGYEYMAGSMIDHRSSYLLIYQC